MSHNQMVRFRNMRLSSLKKFIENEISIQEFLSELSDELREYKKLTGKKGASIPIYVTADIDLHFGGNELRTLCVYFVEGGISTEELAYLADAIDISSHIYVSDDKIKDYVSEMTDPQINGIFTKERASQIIEEIKI